MRKKKSTQSNNDNKNEQKTGSEAIKKNHAGLNKAMPAILIAVAVFIAFCFITQETGFFGQFISSFLLGSFSYVAYAIPLLLVIHGIFYHSDIKVGRLYSRIFFSLALLITASELAYIFHAFGGDLVFDAAEFYTNGQNHIGGGFVGGAVVYGLTKIFGKVGVVILIILAVALYAIYFFSGHNSALKRMFLKKLKGFAEFGAKIERARAEKKAKKDTQKLEKFKIADDKKNASLFEDDFFYADNGISKLEIPELGINETNDSKGADAHKILRTTVIREDDNDFDEPKVSFEPKAEEEPKKNKFRANDIFADFLDSNDGKSADNDKAEDAFKNFQSDDADSVFSGNFNPFDLAKNEKLSQKQSSRAEELRKNDGGGLFSESIDDLTPEKVERLRRLAEFEERKRISLRMREEAKKREQTTETDAYTKSAEADKATLEQNFDSSASITISREKLQGTGLNFDSEDEVDERLEPARKEEAIYEPAVINYDKADLEFEEEYSDDAEDEIEVEDEFESEDEFEAEEEDFAVGEPEEVVSRVEIPESEQNEKINEYRNMFDFFKTEEKDEPKFEEDEESFAEAEETPEDVPFDYDSYEPLTKPTSKPKAEEYIEEEDEEEEAEPEVDYSNYQFPPYDLLQRGKIENNALINEEIQVKAQKLLDTLEAFGIKASIRGYDRGPRITRYSVVPPLGVRVSQIEKLSNDLALNLEAETIRIEAPIPGKSAVGVEIPNSQPSMVSLRDMLESDEFVNSQSKTTICVGKGVDGSNVFADIASMPHLLVAGATGMGKSVCINAFITSMLYKARPDEVKFIMIDPKFLEFAPYNGIPHLLIPVVTEAKKAAGALMWAVDEMNKRYQTIGALTVKNIDSYNQKVKDNPSLGKPMPKIIIFIDELNDLMMQVRDPVENLIMLIAQKARAAGIHLVIGTQRPSVNVLTGVIKANIPSRLSCKVFSAIDSKTILEHSGAEKLMPRGDMLFVYGNKPNPIRVQGSFVSEDETASIIKFITDQYQVHYDKETLKLIEKATQKCSNEEEEEVEEFDESETGYLHDRVFLDAVELAIRSGSIATSYLQRKLRIGYGRAARYLDIMCDLGVVGQKNGTKARDVLLSWDEWQEKLERLTADDY